MFFRRAFAKPLGYAGDYEMMNLIYEERMSAPSSFGRVIDCSVTPRPPLRRAKPDSAPLAAGARAAAAEAGARFASIACGPAHEVKSMLSRPSGLAGRTVTLVDAEAEAIRHCERTIVEPFAESRPDVDLRLLKTSYATWSAAGWATCSTPRTSSSRSACSTTSTIACFAGC